MRELDNKGKRRLFLFYEAGNRVVRGREGYFQEKGL